MPERFHQPSSRHQRMKCSCRALLRLRPIDSDTFRTHYTRPVQRFYEQVAGRAIEPGEWETLDEAYHDSYAGWVERLELAPDAREALAAAEAVGAGCVLYDGGSHHRRALKATGAPVVDRLTDAVAYASVS